MDSHKENTSRWKKALLAMDIKSAIITVGIDAKVDWDVAITDLPGAFLHATNDEGLIIMLNGKLAELMVAAGP